MTILFTHRSYYYTLLGLFVWLSQSQGQPSAQGIGWPPLRVVGVNQGLPQAYVSGVVEDDDGFLWVSTLSGMVRYDGRQMVPFQYESGNPSSISSNSIAHLRKGAPHKLWLHHTGGELDLMDTRTGKCQRFPALTPLLRRLPIGWDTYPSQRTNDVWGVIPRQGVFHFDSRTRRIRWHRRTTGLPSDTVNAVVEEPRGGMWLLSPKGVSRLEVSGQSTLVVRFDDALQRQLVSTALLYETTNAWIRPDGWLLFNTHTQLVRVNTRTGAVVTVPFSAHPTIDQPMMTRQPANGVSYLMASGILYRYSDSAGMTPIWRYYTPKKAGLDDLLGTGIWIDRAGVLWFGANTKGLYRFDPTAFPIQAFPNQNLFCVEAIQHALGISLPTLFNWNFSDVNRYPDYVFRQQFDAQGNMWMGIGYEIGYYSFPRRQFTRLPRIPSIDQVDPQQPLLRGIAVRAGQVWALSYTSRLYRYSQNTGRWDTSFFKRNRMANALLADSTHFWITTVSNGLLRFNPATERWQTILFRKHPSEGGPEQLLDIQPDPSRPDWLWISSYQGLIGFNKRTGVYQRFTTAQGLPDNTIYSILPDKQGYLWLGTNRGLCRFHPLKHTVLTLGLSDGLPGLEFNRFHRLAFPDGRLAFGGVDGWVSFNPQQLQADTIRPTTAITGLQINNQPVDLTGQPSNRPTLFNTLSTLTLNHEQNYLNFTFAALAYHQPDQAIFRYLLDGYDNDWITSRQGSATYTKLPPGTYTLRVNAANKSGQWSPQVRLLPIHIAPPFWASPWAYALYLLLASAGLWGLDRFRIRRAHERQELAFRQAQADELRRLDEAKTRFFTNVSHELRTPLTLILGPLDSVLSRRKVDARDEKLLRTVDHSARQLRDLVTELLDLSRLENGKLKVHTQPVQLGRFLGKCLTLFAGQAQYQSITLATNVTDGVAALWVLMDEDKLRRVMQNLLANACKFTSPGGAVTLQADARNEQLLINVIDSGRGIHPADLPHVFERYYQTQQADRPTEGGTGIGLALCQELVQLMGGTIRVESVLGRGSTFYVMLPLVLAEAIAKQDTPVAEVIAEEPVPFTAAPQDEPSVATEVILVVEDNPQLQAYLTAILTPAFRVLTALNGQAALELLAGLATPPSLIVSDIMMPVMDGFQLLETLKASPAYRAIPIVMLTARTESDDKLRALRLGVDDYLQKPFNETELMARITTLLHNQHERKRQSVLESNEDELPSALPYLSTDDLTWLSQLEQLVKQKLGQFDLTADELADELAMSRRTFYRTMKRLTGLTPAQYVTEARFQEARRLFETHQSASIKQVAYKVGYRQTSHFAQLYQQRFGRSPADYR